MFRISALVVVLCVLLAADLLSSWGGWTEGGGRGPRDVSENATDEDSVSGQDGGERHSGLGEYGVNMIVVIIGVVIGMTIVVLIVRCLMKKKVYIRGPPSDDVPGKDTPNRETGQQAAPLTSQKDPPAASEDTSAVQGQARETSFAQRPLPPLPNALQHEYASLKKTTSTRNALASCGPLLQEGDEIWETRL